MKRLLLALLTPWLAVPVLLSADTGVVVRETPLLDKPSLAGKVLLELGAGSEVEVLRREGLWFEVAVEGAAAPGWVRFSRVRVVESKVTQTQTQSGGSDNVLVSLSRSATGLFGYGNRQAQSGSVATVGIRGLNASDLQAARPDPKEIARLNTYRASPDAARLLARVGGLSSHEIAYLQEEAGGGFGLSLPSLSAPSTSSSLKGD